MHGFRPRQTISATYLWQNNKNIDHRIDETVDISVSMHATCTGMIQGINQLVNILWDTGATQCLISGKTAEQIGSTFTRFPVPYRKVILGDSKQISIVEAVKLMVQVQGHYLELICYAFPATMVEDLVIWVKVLAELKAKYTVSTGEVRILNQSQKILSCEEIHLVPDEETTIRCRLGKAPWKIQNVQIIVKVHVTNKQQYQMLRVKVQDDQVALKFVNTTPSSIKIKQGQLLGCMGLRSIGMYVVE